MANNLKIGELNGKWAMMLKITLALAMFMVPAVVGLQVWFVRTISDIRLHQVKIDTQLENFVAQGPRYTPAMARADNLQLRHDLLETVAAGWPPEWVKEELREMEERIRELEQEQ